MSFGALHRLGLIGDGTEAAISALQERIDEDGIETVRFLFVDPHGVLRGKALVADAVTSACRNGVTVPSSLLLKDSAHRTVFPVWSGDAGFGPGVMTGAGDALLVPDPTTYRRLPWSPHSAWILCDTVQPDGAPIPFAPRTVLATALGKLHTQDMDLVCGLEVEFHILKVTEANLTHEQGGMPGTPPDTAPLNHGYQLLSEAHYGRVEPILDDLRRNALGLGLPVRSVEVEFGASQFEVTFDPAPAMDHADTLVMFRAMAKEICARHGLHATFMCRPPGAHGVASGWHVHQSVVDLVTRRNLFMPEGDGQTAEAAGWIAGILAHAAESCLLTTPTVNGYRRYQPHQLAPDRIQWGRDNRGAMLRDLTRPGDTASRVENRAPDPLGTPHVVLAAQIASGLSGLRAGMTPPAPADTPYDGDAPALPANLGAAIAAFAAGSLYREMFGEAFAHYMIRLKTAEWERYLAELSTWEIREYLGTY